MKRTLISLVTLIIIISGAVFVSAYVMASHNTANESYESRSAIVSVKTPMNQAPPSFTDRDLITLTDRYISLIKQEVDDDYRLINVATIAELYVSFDEISTREVSEAHVSYYFTETEAGVYLRPTELPPWFEKDVPYAVNRVSDKEVIVEQTVEDLELYGPYRITFHFNYTDRWRMSQVDTESLGSN